MEKQQALNMENIAQGPFTPVYPLIAKQTLQQINQKTGLCIDLGSGGGQFGIAIAQQSEFDVIAMDKNPYALEIALENAKKAGIEDRFQILENDVADIKLADNTVDLCVSRGMLWFWEDGVQAFKEIYRILKPNAKAFIGCGFGSEKVLNDVIENMAKSFPDWNEYRLGLFENNPIKLFEQDLKKANISSYELIDESYARWIIITK